MDEDKKSIDTKDEMAVAVIGMSGRFPGSKNLGEFWKLLDRGQDAISTIPAERWDTAFYKGDPRREANKTVSIWAGCLDGVDRFDARFFRVSPKEAEVMDPQQRILLELAWHALEDAALCPSKLAGSKTGVFIGACNDDYSGLIDKDLPVLDGYVSTGNFFSILSNRLSYFFDFHGPSFTVDTACSSSLVAVHQAVRSIQLGESTLALAGGVNICWTPKRFIAFSAAGMLSVDGKCKTFDASANGYVRGEGAGIVVLKSLKAALADGDPIYGLIKSSAINHGGKTSSLTVTNPKQQAELIATVIEQSGVDPKTIGYVETHGTGTSLGDPIEAHGLKLAFGRVMPQTDSRQTPFCGLGSVKTNIGHLEAAAGIAGMIKVLLAMRHRCLPASLNVKTLNPLLKLDGSPFYVVTKNQEWPQPVDAQGQLQPRRAGVSSFGFGGAYAHILLEAYEPQAKALAADGKKDVERFILNLSARTPERLTAYVKSLRDYLDLLPPKKDDHTQLGALQSTLLTGREELAHRVSIIAHSRQDLIAAIDAYSTGITTPVAAVFTGEAPASHKASTVSRTTFEGKSLEELVQLWTGGAHVPWHELGFAKAPRQSQAPSYPFSPDRHWLPSSGTVTRETASLRVEKPSSVTQPKGLSNNERIEKNSLHPLLDINDSTFQSYRFSKWFSGQEFVLADHHVLDHAVLPGVAFLEMARAAGQQLTGVSPAIIKDIVWSRAFSLDAQAKTLTISLVPSSNAFAFRAFSETNGLEQIHVQGRIELATTLENSTLIAQAKDGLESIQTIRQRCSKVVQQAAIYNQFTQLGLELGDSFRSVQNVYVGESESLGQLKLPEHLLKELSQWVLHPALIDGALQTAIQMLDGAADKLHIPFALDRIEIFAIIPPNCYVHAREIKSQSPGRTGHRFDIAILNESNQVVAQLTNFVARAVEKISDQPAPTSTLETSHSKAVYLHKWVMQPAMAQALVGLRAFKHLMVVGASNEFKDELLKSIYPDCKIILVNNSDRYTKQGDHYFLDLTDSTVCRHLFVDLKAKGQTPDCLLDISNVASTISSNNDQILKSGLMAIFNLTQALILSKPVNTTRVCYVYGGPDIYPEHDAVAGMMRTIELEHPKLTSQSLFVNRLHTSGADLLKMIEQVVQTSDQEVRHDAKGQRWVKSFTPVSMPSDEARSSLICQKGVYLITGGCGGLGEIVAKHLISNYQANLVLLGRRPEQDVRVQIDALRRFGTEVLYLSCDVADLPSVTKCIEMANARFGRLNGVFHCAGSLDDSFFLNKQRESFLKVLSPKRDGSRALDLATQSQQLDFFVLFSSITSVAGNLGQSDYGSANRFLDSFAQWRNLLVKTGERYGHTLSIAWPYWEEGGMLMSTQAISAIENRLGIRPLPTAAGLEILDCILDQSSVPAGTNFVATYGQAFKLVIDQPEMTKPDGQDVKTAVSLQETAVVRVEDSVSAVRHILEQQLVDIVANTLKMSSDEIELHVNLSQYGFESLALVDFTTQLNAKFNLDTSPTLFFEFDNVADVANHLLMSFPNHFDALANKKPNPSATEQDHGHRSEAHETLKEGHATTVVSQVGHSTLLESQKFALEEQLIELVATTLKMPSEEIDPVENLSIYGFESLALVEFTTALNDRYGLNTSPTLFFEFDNVRAVADHLLASFPQAFDQHLLSDAIAPADADTVNEVVESQLMSSVQPEDDNDDPVVIVGMGGKFPKSPDLNSFWKNLEAGRDLVSEIPSDRWDWKEYWGDPVTEPNKTNIKWGGFIDDVDKFDAEFFKVSPREAQLMDPQQRLMLEVVWEAIEDSGYRASDLAKKTTGLMIGVSTDDYHDLARRSSAVEPYTTTGSVFNILANRISYLLNLTGPSFAVDTACSSSLIAMHQGVRALENGDCDVVIAGGVNIMLSPYWFVSFGKAGMLSPDGRCKTFDRDANGYVRGEGAGAVVMMRLSQARAEGVPIYGIVRGSAISHGGKAVSMTAPNLAAHVSLLKRAYSTANIDPSTITYIEAHGTGTSLGDPVEVDALQRSFAELIEDDSQTKTQFCGLGSVKTNIGHLEAGAGIAGVIKVLLAMKHRRIPASLHCHNLNPYIRLEKSPFHIVTETRDWTPLLSSQGEIVPRRAGISSFGFGGAYAHIILEEAPLDRQLLQSAAQRLRQPETASSHVFVLSAKNHVGLKVHAENVLAYLMATSVELSDLIYTLQIGREEFEERLAIVVASLDELRQALSVFLKTSANDVNIFHGVVSQKGKKRSEPGTNSNTEHSTIADNLAIDSFSLARGWVKGEHIDWRRFQPTSARRLALPTYPFARDAHWITQSPSLFGRSSADSLVTSLHPVIDCNASNFSGIVFRKTLTARDCFITDHLVGDQAILPGVVYLEMVRAAAQVAGPVNQTVFALKDVTWTRPISLVNESVDIAIHLNSRDGIFLFSIREWSHHETSEAIEYAHGSFETQPSDVLILERVDINELRPVSSQVFSSSQCYQIFDQLGIHYGNSLQGISRVNVNGVSAFGELQLPSAMQDNFEKFVLHPSLLDSALQCTLILIESLPIDKRGLQLPFSLGRLEIFKVLSKQCFARVKLVSDLNSRVLNFTIELLNTEGEICIRLIDLLLRPVKTNTNQSSNSNCLFIPDWSKQAPQASVSLKDIRTVLVLEDQNRLSEHFKNIFKRHAANIDVIQVKRGERFCKDSDDCFVVGAAAESDFKELLTALNDQDRLPTDIVVSWSLNYDRASTRGGDVYRSVALLTQALLRVRSLDKRYKNVRLVYLFEATSDLEQAEHLAFGAFARSVRLECPEFDWCAVRVAPKLVVADSQEFAELCLAELQSTSPESALVCRANVSRQVLNYQPVVLPAREGNLSNTIKNNAVCLITGGVGGLGIKFATYLARKRNAKVVLSSRSRLNAEQVTYIESLNKAGLNVSFFQADISDRVSTQDLIKHTIDKFGCLDVIIHAAGVTRDAYLLRDTLANMNAVCDPKIQGVLNLDVATRALKLDCFVLFSSVVGALGNEGQSSYAFANSYLDHFSQARESLRLDGIRQGKTISIQWPYWKEGGLRIDAEQLLNLAENKGLVPLETSTGFDLFESILESNASTVLVMHGRVDKIQELVTQPSRPVTRSLATEVVRVATISTAIESLSRPSDDLLLSTAQDILRTLVAEETRLPIASIQLNSSFERFGVDSMLITSMNRKLEKRFGKISKTIFFEYDTIAELAAYFVAHHSEKIISSQPVAEAVNVRPEQINENVGPSSSATPVSMTATTEVTNASVSQGRHDDIAIIGVSGRYPQAADLDEFWEILKSGRDCITEIPADRWDFRDDFNEQKGLAGKSYSKWGGFLDNVDKFDPLFFSISPREAELMDPQERLFLETAWWTLEDAGYTTSRLRQQAVGVFAGVMYGHYQLYGAEESLRGNSIATISSHASVANRVSYALGLTGPSIGLDTMCSSSLTAIHLACNSIRNGECDLAIAGGVNLSIHPNKYIMLSQGRFVSSDGHCRSFGEGGDGYVPGEGVGAVLLKPLSQARQDGDHIYAVVRGSAINHGGHGKGYTVPSPKAQGEVIQAALNSSAVSISSLSYLEAHGTGTALGDPIEISGLNRVFGQLPDAGVCAIGSVKSNIGHLESAAGIAGLTKVLLQLKYKTLVPSIFCDPPNPNIDFDETSFVVQRHLSPWNSADDMPRRAGISSFGAGGANAHLVVEEYVQSPVVRQYDEIQKVIVLSAKDSDRLIEYAQKIIKRLSDTRNGNELTLDSLAYTLQTGREPMRARLAFTASNLGEVLSTLTAFAARATSGLNIFSGVLEDDQVLSLNLLELAKRGEWSAFCDGWVKGGNLSFEQWRSLYRPPFPIPVSLPGYPFARERYWIRLTESKRSTEPLASLEHVNPFFHFQQESDQGSEVVFSVDISPNDWLVQDHVVSAKKVCPGVFYLEFARRAAMHLGVEINTITDVIWGHPVIVTETSVKMYLHLRREAQQFVFRAVTKLDQKDIDHAHGVLYLKDSAEPKIDGMTRDVQQIVKRSIKTIPQTEVYQRFEKFGVHYGQAFQVTQRVYCGEDEALVALALPTKLMQQYGVYTLDPALLDGALRASYWCDANLGLDDGSPYIPFALDRLEIFEALPETCYGYATRVEASQGMFRWNIDILTMEGRVVIRASGLTGRAVKPDNSLHYYQPQWLAQNLTNESNPRLTNPGAHSAQRIVVFARDVDNALASCLNKYCADSHQVVFVSASHSYKRTSEGFYQINPTEPQHYQQLLRDLELSGPVEFFLHAWAIDQAPSSGLSAALKPNLTDLETGLDCGIYSLLYLFQALGNRKARCVFAYADSLPEHVMVGGLAASLTTVNHRFELVTAGVTAGVTQQACATQLLQELETIQSRNGAQVRLTEAGRLARAWTSMPLPVTTKPSVAPIRHRGVYVISGGAGVIGRALALHLAKSYQARLIIVGRSPLDANKEAQIAGIHAVGGEGRYVATDLTSHASVQHLIDSTRSHFKRIDGVIHCAGDLSTRALMEASREEFDEILSAKVEGTMHLDLATQADDLDFFAMFSSVSSVLGDFGYGSYAASNRYLDAFAANRQRQREQGKRSGVAVSILWPLWKNSGMSLDSGNQEKVYFEYTGMSALETATGMQAFEHALICGQSEVLVASGDRARIERVLKVDGQVADNQHVIKYSASNVRRMETAVPVINNSSSHQRREVRDTDLLKLTQNYVAALISKVSRVPLQRITPRTRFEEFGIDSVMVMEMTSLLSNDLGSMSGTLLFEYNNIEDLSRYLMSQHLESLIKLTATEESAGVNHDDPRLRVLADDRPSVAASKPIANKLSSSQKGPVSEDGIAIIGLAGRYPKANDLDAFWANLKEGVDCIEEIPSERWDSSAYYSAERGVPGRSHSKWGGFIQDMDKFDPLFFKLSPLQARAMDPQERLFLEVAWATVEDAGYTRSHQPRAIGDQVGVFVGVMWDDYKLIGLEATAAGQYTAAAADFSSIANRVSYILDLHGPSLAVDTACSSSLMAIHLACESLQRRECEYAIAGGVNLSLHPSKYQRLSDMGMLSTDGRCRSFGANGDGYVPGEGVGAVLLKPLSAALKDGDHIYGIVKSSVANHGGRTNGFTVPSPVAQASLVKAAIDKAGIDVNSISYIEAHGTGTSLGDPVEITGLTTAFEARDQDVDRCAVGSVKSNIGHLEGAAGIAALTKVLLQIKHEALVPSLHSETVNPLIDFDHSPFVLQRHFSTWKRLQVMSESGPVDLPRRAGISSFGAGGANVHLIIEEPTQDNVQTVVDEFQSLLVLSAKNEQRLAEYAGNLRDYLIRSADLQQIPSLADIAYTLQCGREPMEARLAFIAKDRKDAIRLLTQFCEKDQSNPKLHHGLIKQQASAVELLLDGGAGQQFIESVTRDNDLDRLAALWVLGIGINWSLLMHSTQCKIVELPTYPFEQKRYWMTAKSEVVTKSAPAVLRESPTASPSESYPLIDQIKLDTLHFYKTLRDSDPVMRDHKVRGKLILPGVAYLEIVLEALSILSIPMPVELSGIHWLEPLVTDKGRVRAMLALSTAEQGYDFEVSSPFNDANRKHAIGRISNRQQSTRLATNRPNIDLEHLKRTLPHCKKETEIYSALTDIGLAYGVYFQTLERLWIGADEALGEVRLSDSQLLDQRYIFHPGLADGLLQSVIGLVNLSSEGETITAVPYALGALQVFQPLTRHCYAYVKRVGSLSFDITMTNANGQVLAFCSELLFRPLLDKKPLDLYVPVWRASRALSETRSPAEHFDVVRTLCIEVGSMANLCQHLVAQYPRIRCVKGKDAANVVLSESNKFANIVVIAGEQGDAQQGAVELFNFVKALAKNGYADIQLKWTLVTCQAHWVTQADILSPWSSGLHGLLKAVAKEYLKWQFVAIDLDQHVESQHFSEAVLSEQHSAVRLVDIAFRDGVRYQRSLRVLEPVVGARQTAFRSKGVYLIYGGLGGLGYELSLYLSQCFDARLILIGRGEIDDTKRTQIAEIEALGGQVSYFSQAEPSVAELRRILSEATAKYGRLNGVFHSAMVLINKSIADLSEAEFTSSLTPKVAGTIALAEILRQESLDFLMFFSSISALEVNSNQAGYAAACAFKDAYAHYFQKQVSFPVKIINWGYWDPSSASRTVLTAEFRRRLVAAGIEPISREDGLNAIEQILLQPAEQVVATHLAPSMHETLGVDPHQAIRHYPTLQPNLLDQNFIDAVTRTVAITDNVIEAHEQLERLQAFCVSRVLNILTRMGISLKKEAVFNRTQFVKSLGVIPKYAQLADLMIELLVHADILSVQSDVLIVTEVLELNIFPHHTEYIEAERVYLCDSFAALTPYVRLVDACIDAYPSVLSGAVSAIDVLFPEGSTALVENVYAGNALAETYNQIVAQVVAHYCKSLLTLAPHAPIRILEVGAGTGGVTRAILPALAGLSGAIEYVYTDISASFLKQGRNYFHERYPFTSFQILDLEKDAIDQGFALGSFDVIVASNVLHATTRITTTLERAKNLLKTNGILVLNEGVQQRADISLSFGLTTGWWHFEDPEHRMLHSPLIKLDRWFALLSGIGFHSTKAIGIPSVPSAEWDQAVIVSASDGKNSVIRASATERSTESVKQVPIDTTLRDTTELLENLDGKAINQKSAEALDELATTYVKSIFHEVLGIDQNDIDIDATYDRYGVDSLVVIEINKRFEKDFGKLPVALLFEYMTIRKLAGYFLNEQAAVLAELIDPQPKREEVTVALDLEMPSVPPVVEEQVASNAQPPLSDDLQAIAIIGISGRYPRSRNLKEFWNNLTQGVNCISEVPEDRWDWREYFDPNPEANGKTYSRWGGFIGDVDKFDPLFFGIAPVDAAQMDPQERLFLETAWGALEDAGYTRDAIAKTDRKVGVFAGVMNNDYEWLGARASELSTESDGRSSYWSIANRVSYVFDFQGPSFTIDSACSSSLTAIHLACSSIRQGECGVAIAGGVNLILHPAHYVRLSRARMLSFGDQCKAFGEGADGFVDGEGVGALILKPLSQAERDGDHIYAVIKGSAINAGGRTSGYTVPNPTAQTNVIEQAYQRSGVDVASVSYIEAHGTGTALGDPIELSALTKAFKGSSSVVSPHCKIGSVKTNIGHLEAAAGIAGITKIILQMQHRLLVPSLHSAVLNSELDLRDSPFAIQKTLQVWSGSDGENTRQPLRAGISSFGGGGANAHLILESYENNNAKSEESGNSTDELIVLSARSADRLNAYATALLSELENQQQSPRSTRYTLSNVAYTLAVGREVMDYRLAIVASDLTGLRISLQSYLDKSLLNDRKIFQGKKLSKNKLTPSSLLWDAEHIGDALKARRLEQLGEIWVTGAAIDWHMLFSQRVNQRLSLPGYPFAGERYWVIDTVASSPKVQPNTFEELPDAAQAATQTFNELPDATKTATQAMQYFSPQYLPLSVSIHQATRESGRRILILANNEPSIVETILVENHSDDHVEIIRLDFDILFNDVDQDSDWLRSEESIAHFRQITSDVDVIYQLTALQSMGYLRSDEKSAFLSSQQQKGVFTLFRLIKGLDANDIGSRDLRLVVVTNDSIGIGSQAIQNPYSADIHGLAATACREYPTWKISCVDVSLTEVANDFSRAKQIAQCIEEAPVGISALRGVDFFQRSLQQVELRSESRDPYRAGGTYLIVGGSGGVGRLLSLHLAKNYRARVLWIGRKPADSIDPLIKLTIESAGGELNYFQCDIADVEKLERVVQTVRSSFGTIHGVFHSGMHLVDGLIGSLSERSFREGMACKVDGSVNLVHSLLKDDLDFFVFFSSAGAFGSDRAIASYAAAVSFEDAFALSIARETRTVIRVINWGYWGEVGTGAKAGLRERFASEGLTAFTVAEGLEAIRRIITSDIEQVMPITADPKFLRQLGVLTPNALQAVLPTKKPAPSLKNIRKQLMQLSEA